MEVDYREALASLESMFPNFDRESIQAVLASNGIVFSLNSSLLLRWTYGENY